MLFFALIMGLCMGYSQDLSVIYKIKINKAPKEVKKALKKAPKSNFVMKFSGTKTFTKIDLFGFFTQTTVFDSEKGEGFLLMDLGAQKFMVKVNKEQLDEYNKGNDLQPVVQKEKGSKKVMGYACNKALLKYSDGKEYTMYYTSEIEYKHENFQYLDGFPLLYEATMNKLNVTMEATAVDQKTKLNPTLFEAPTSGYQEISFEKLMEMQSK